MDGEDLGTRSSYDFMRPWNDRPSFSSRSCGPLPQGGCGLRGLRTIVWLYGVACDDTLSERRYTTARRPAECGRERASEYMQDVMAELLEGGEESIGSALSVA